MKLEMGKKYKFIGGASKRRADTQYAVDNGYFKVGEWYTILFPEDHLGCVVARWGTSNRWCLGADCFEIKEKKKYNLPNWF